MTEEPKTEPRLFDYLDYRHYLKDFYQFKKAGGTGFSLQTFAKKAGFSSRSFLLLVMQGKRDVTPRSLEGFCRALDFNQKERGYFENLVGFTQAKSEEAKRHYYEQLVPYYKREAGNRLRANQYEYLSRWYAPVIREMIMTKNFKEDPAWIAKKLKNKIMPLEAKKCLKLLSDLNLVERTSDGKLKVTDINVTTPLEVADAMAAKFHDEMLEMARSSIAEDHETHREISGITAALSPAKFERIKQAIQEFGNRIMHEMEQPDDEAEHVYQLHFQLFPLTRIEQEKR